ncbi:hypothetical protein H3C61_02285 [Candidatus Gracilibacteria bacterium]|nr:hypothetical protein [Candidatus Gracilibacteria bacterium]
MEKLEKNQSIPENKNQDNFGLNSIIENTKKNTLNIIEIKEFLVDSSFMEKHSNEELINFLINGKYSYLNINQLREENNQRQINRIIKILVKNFPLIESLRLSSGDKILNIHLAGIKQINDNIGKEFCDKLILKFKEFIALKIILLNSGKSTRIIKDDYKNIGFIGEFNNIDNLGIINKNKSDIIERLISNMIKDIYQEAIKLVLNDLSLTNQNISNNEKDILIIKKYLLISKIIHQNFNFGISINNIPNELNNFERINLLRKAEISSRNSLKEKIVSIKEYNEDNLIHDIKENDIILNNILENYEHEKFLLNGNKYDVISNEFGEKSLSLELIRYIRKNSTLVLPKRLSSLVSLYISGLNSNLDFISPLIKELSEDNLDFKIASRINRQIQKGTINIGYLTKNYKGGITKETFINKLDEMSGSFISIDIKDLGVYNILSFIKLSKEIINLEKELKDGKINKDKFDKKISLLLLNAGNDLTLDLQKIQKEFKKQFKNGIIKFGGDEIEIFIPGENKIQKNIIDKIENIINKSNFRYRLVTSSIKGKDDINKLYKKLDNLNQINKIIERNLEISKEYNNIKTTFLEIDEELKQVILDNIFPFNNLIINLNNILNKTPIDFNNVADKFIIDLQMMNLKMELLKEDDTVEIKILKK